MRQIIPFVLHDKLVQDPDCPFFEVARERHVPHRQDRLDPQAVRPGVRGVRAAGPGPRRPGGRARAPSSSSGLDGVAEREVRARLVKIERVLGQWSKSRKFYGHMFDDVLKLKYLHQRYTNYLRWLEWKGEQGSAHRNLPVDVR